MLIAIDWSIMNFDESFIKLMEHEGGYVNNLKDPGGETRYGISKRSYPNVNIKTLTLEGAKIIYKIDYWDKCRCDELPESVRFDVFDAAVNSGVNRATVWLQDALNVKSDGIIGAQTLNAVNSVNGDILSKRYNGTRLLFMTTLDGFKVFGRGWTKRIAENLLQ